jgi:hypothetical protein
MKKIWSCLLWGLGLVIVLVGVVVAWAWKPYHLTVSDVNACTVDAECIMVPEGICSRPVSINQVHQKQWDLHQKLVRLPPSNIMCAPNLPFDAYQPECLQNACRAVLKEEHAVLEFPRAPRLGEPTELLFRFKTSADVDVGEAQIEFIPNLVTVHSGELTWQGPLPAGTEEEMRVRVTFSKPGRYQVHGEAPSSMQGRQKQEANIYLLIKEDGVQYFPRFENGWDLTHVSYPVGEADRRIEREFLFDPVPGLNVPVTVVYRVRSRVDLEAATLQIVLPPAGFELLEATYPGGGEHGETPQVISIVEEGGKKREFNMPLQLWWRGPVHTGETLEIRATVKVVAPGWGTAYGWLNSGNVLPDNLIYAFVYVDEYNGFYEIREKP